MTTSVTVPPVDTLAPGLQTRLPEGTFASQRTMLLGVGVIAVAASVAGPTLFGAEWKQFLYSYLVAYMFTLAIVLGSMFFVLVQHLTRAGWSVVVRRIAENGAATLLMFVPLFIPLVIGGQSPPAYRRAQRFGSGWYGFFRNLELTRESLEGLEAEAGARPPGQPPLEISITPPPGVGRDDAERYRDLGVDRLTLFPTARDEAGLLRFVEESAGNLVRKLA